MGRVYIAKEKVPTIDLACANYGFTHMGHEVIHYDNIEEVPLGVIAVVGYIDDLQSYFVRAGIGMQTAINIPPELHKPEYLKRQVRTCAMGTFREFVDVPIFIKPARYPKEFMAGVIKKQSSKDFLKDVEDGTRVMISDVVDFVSEYRCYVRNGKLLGIKNYQGDIRVFPDVAVIDKMIGDYKAAPRGYSLDVGILSTGETVLVEVQDGWALGNYGLECDEYANLLLARWSELLKSQ